MYNQAHNNNNISSYSYPPLDHLELEFEGSNMAAYYANYSSSSSSYGGSPTSNSVGAFESLSLRKGSSSSLLHVLPEEEDSSQNAPVRRVYSASDLESVNSYMAMRRSLQRAESPLSISNENNLIIEGILKATKYNPQEKKERIERYRNKRNQRNFHKKIQYTCRKTLADSRPRIKGRFVRNDDISTSRITSANMTTTDGNYTTIDSCYDGEFYSLLNDQYSSTHHHQQQQQQQQHQHMMMNVNAREEELQDECEEEMINYNWVNLFDCSYPISSQYEH